jgi:hypothetical protein
MRREQIMAILILFFLSCSNKQSKKIIIRDVYEVKNEIETFSNNYFDSIKFLGLTLGNTTLKDLGKNYYTRDISRMNEKSFVVSINNTSNGNFQEMDILSLSDKDLKNYEFEKKIKFHNRTITAYLTFFEDKLVRINVSDFPFKFIEELNLLNYLKVGYVKDISYKIWLRDYYKYLIYSKHRVKLKTENDEMAITFNYAADSTINLSKVSSNLKSSLIIEDKKKYSLFLSSRKSKPIRKESEKEFAYRQKLVELNQLYLNLISKDIDKNTQRVIIDKMINVENELNKFKDTK